MTALLVALFAALRAGIRSRLELEAEILALRHQLAVLQRQAPRRPRLGPTDRLLWVLLARLWPNWRRAVQIVTPDTVLRWRRSRRRAERSSRSRTSAGCIIITNGAPPDRHARQHRQVIATPRRPPWWITSDRSRPKDRRTGLSRFREPPAGDAEGTLAGPLPMRIEFLAGTPAQSPSAIRSVCEADGVFGRDRPRRTSDHRQHRAKSPVAGRQEGRRRAAARGHARVRVERGRQRPEQPPRDRALALRQHPADRDGL
jgi:hypothetical protein